MAAIMKRRYFVTLALLTITAAGCNSTSANLSTSSTPLSTNNFTGNDSTVEVYRSASCGCCGLWVEHMQQAGFTVTETITEELNAVKAKHGVPNQLASCHTAIVDGYVVEGHIPSEDVQRLLAEKPAVTGIAVPGMPIGSPGMEVGNEREPYAVLSFKGETIETFATHP